MKNRQPPKRSKAWREHRHDKSEETDIDELNLEILGLWRCSSCEVINFGSLRVSKVRIYALVYMGH